ncbi:MAG: 3-isopropylmalate dehydratase, large subunit [Anaerosporomusa subterranea]|jgi:3-isopropylmalate/(R)-2-methylmalate dehydratase large subunit|nr:3-isopropylmalate dehydratase, large subunit [Anaerosporomusa subterranea]
MTLSEVVLSGASVAAEGAPGFRVDYCIVNDAVSHSSVDYMSKAQVFNNKHVAVVLDHDTPSGSVEVSAIQRKLINFAKQHDTLFYNGEGIGYQLLLDNHVKAGQVVVGCGNHMAVFGAVGAVGLQVSPETLAKVMQTGTVEFTIPDVVNIKLSGKLQAGVLAKDVVLTVLRTWRADKLSGKIIEFSGDAFRLLSMNDRITLCNLTTRTGAATAIVNPDETNAIGYSAYYQLDLGTVSVCVAKPDNFEDIVDVEQLQTISVKEVFIGGCSAGRIEDLRIAAGIIRGKKTARGVRMMIAPATSGVYVQALREGLITDFINAGAIVMNQGCSVCWGKSQGIIDTNEVLVSAGSYHCKGCAGADTAKVYLASAATAATSAVTGVITAPKIG